MTTPRIEEHTKELQRKAREKLDNAEVPELWSEDSYKYLYLFLDQIIADTVHQTRQAGIDEVMERLIKHFESYLLDWKDGMDRNDPDIRVNAVIEIIKALQDNK